MNKPLLNDPTYPEHEKLAAIKERSQAIGGFLEWLDEKGIVLCTLRDEFGGEQYFPIYRSINDMLAGHFGIDLNVLEQEKRAMLADITSPIAMSNENSHPSN